MTGPLAVDTAVLVGAIGSLFGILMLEMRGRRDRAERQVDSVLEDNRKLVASMADLTNAVRELHTLVVSDRPPTRR